MGMDAYMMGKRAHAKGGMDCESEIGKWLGKRDRRASSTLSSISLSLRIVTLCSITLIIQRIRERWIKGRT
jgi:hypothetical protein